jgi:hypothetical protein
MFHGSCQTNDLQNTYEDPPKASDAGPDIGQYTFDVNLFNPTDVKSRVPVMGNVMCIRRRDGLAYRVGMGQIHLSAWTRANPRKRRILLA